MMDKTYLLDEKLSSLAAIGAFAFFISIQAYGWYLAFRAMAA